MGIPRQHLPRNMPCNVHDRLIASTVFGQLGYEGVPSIVETPFGTGSPPNVAPPSFQRGYGPGGVVRPRHTLRRFTRPARKNVPFRIGGPESPRIPSDVLVKNGMQFAVDRYCSPLASIRLARSEEHTSELQSLRH